MTRKYLFLLGSSRRDGNTEVLARRAAEQLDAEQRWVFLDDVPLPPFRDIRHTVGGWPAPEGNEKLLYDATVEATDLVIASPTYWYTVSAATKLYLDYWSGWLRVPGFTDAMAGKRMWAVTVLGEEPEQAEPLLGMLKRSAAYMRMEWGGELIGNGSRPGDVLRDTAALTRAKEFFPG
ncbi:NAD(P)H-dependent oxidoreductase [Actinosynnema sp. NPDC023658]|uniref:flavodoxin family protein n=1 Tax=Actinosynnema sp. NPDC023658 TaxID=3155465 RepID=UPI0033FD9C14